LYNQRYVVKDCVWFIDTLQKKIDDKKLFISIDTESYEFEHDKLTEFGWSIFKKNGEIIKNRHLIVKENMEYHNKVYVPDNRDHYNFGKSEIKELKEIIRELNEDLKKVNYIVGQGINNDIKDLKEINVDISKYKKMRATTVYEYGIIETMDLYMGYNTCYKHAKLEDELNNLNISYERLHNAGNDAYYTMKFFVEVLKKFDIHRLKYRSFLRRPSYTPSNNTKKEQEVEVEIEKEWIENDENNTRDKKDKDQDKEKNKRDQKNKKDKKIFHFKNDNLEIDLDDDDEDDLDGGEDFDSSELQAIMKEVEELDFSD
jgi:hypothetical protein